MDYGPPKAQSAEQDLPAPSLGRGCRENMLADIAELAADVEDTNVHANPVGLSSAALEPLVAGQLPISGGMQATDTESQEAVEDFEMAPSQVNSHQSRVSGGVDQITSRPTFGNSGSGQLDQRLHGSSADHVHGADVAVGAMGAGNSNSKGGLRESPSEVHGQVKN